MFGFWQIRIAYFHFVVFVVFVIEGSFTNETEENVLARQMESIFGRIESDDSVETGEELGNAEDQTVVQQPIHTEQVRWQLLEVRLGTDQES